MVTLAVLLASAPAVFGQASATGSLSGSVTDPSAGVLPGVAVTAQNPATGLTRTAVTDGDGAWSIQVLPVGRYTVSFELDGFKKLVRENVNVEAAVSSRARRNARSRRHDGDGDRATAASMLVERSSPPRIDNFPRRILEEHSDGHAQLHASVVRGSGRQLGSAALLVNGTGNISPSVNGTRTTSTSLFFNGFDVTNVTNNEGSLNDNISPAPETLQEVKLQTSLYDASTGRSGGGNFQLVTKSGTNTTSGSLYYSFQHENLNANDFFFDKDGIDKPKARRNEGGFVIGGPIRRNKLFFFGGYQRSDAETGFVPTASSISTLPQALGLINGAADEREHPRGLRSTQPGHSVGHPEGRSAARRATGPAFPTSRSRSSPSRTRSPATTSFRRRGPNAQLVGTDAAAAGGNVGGNPWVRQRNVQPSEYQQDQVNLSRRAAHRQQPLERHVLLLGLPRSRLVPRPGSLVSPFTLKRADRARVFALSDTQIWSSSMVGESRAGVFFLDNNRQLDDPFLAITNEQIGVPNPANFFDSSAATTRLGHYIGNPGTILERFSFGGPNDSFNQREQWIYSIGQTMTWSRGSHTMRFGGDTSTTCSTRRCPEEQATEFEKFENFTMFLRGLATRRRHAVRHHREAVPVPGLQPFVADDWRLSPKLTLNLGLRYEFFGWPWEKNGRIGNVDFTRSRTRRIRPTPSSCRATRGRPGSTPSTRRSRSRPRPTTSTRSTATI